MGNTTDIEFGNVDADKTCAVEIKHDDKMRDDTPAYVQVGYLLLLSSVYPPSCFTIVGCAVVY